MYCVGDASSLSFLNTGLRHGCLLAPSLLISGSNFILGETVDLGQCKGPIGINRFTDLVFAVDAVKVAETLEDQVGGNISPGISGGEALGILSLLAQDICGGYCKVYSECGEIIEILDYCKYFDIVV